MRNQSEIGRVNKISKAIGMFFVCIGILFLYCKSQVRADLIVEPADNFYEEHSDECEYVKRTYITNSEEGYVNLYVSPESKTVVSSVENGTQVFISFTYEDEDGTVWGVVMDTAYFEGTRVKAAWMNLNECYVKYDHSSFMKDHQAEIIYGELSFDFSDYKKDVILWTYPQSGEISNKLDPSTDYARDYNKTFDSYYEDNKQRKWIRIDYYMTGSGWICASDPTNTKIKEVVQENKEPKIIYPSANSTASEESSYEIIVALILTISLIVGTAAVIHKLYKKEKH